MVRRRRTTLQDQVPLADLLQPQVVEMLPHQPDHVLVARRQALLLRDAIGDAAAVAAGRRLVVVDVDGRAAIVGDRQPVGVGCRGGGRLSVVGAVPTRRVGVGLLRRPVRLHVAADDAALKRSRGFARLCGTTAAIQPPTGPLTQMRCWSVRFGCLRLPASAALDRFSSRTTRKLSTKAAF